MNTPKVSPIKYVDAVSRCKDGSICGDKINELPSELIIEARKPTNKIERQCMIFEFLTDRSKPIQPTKRNAQGAQRVPTRTMAIFSATVSPSSQNTT